MTKRTDKIISINEERLKEIIKETLTEIIQQNEISLSTTISKDMGDIHFAMKITGLAKSTIYNKIQKREIPFHRKGRLYFSKSELESWMRSGNNEIDITKHIK